MTPVSTLLVRRGLASMRQVEEALARQALYGGDVVTNLLEVAPPPATDEAALAAVHAEALELPPALAEQIREPDPKAVARLDRSLAEAHGAVPIAFSAEALTLVVSEALASDSIEALSAAVGGDVRLVAAPFARMRLAMQRAYGVAMDERARRLIARLDGEAAVSADASSDPRTRASSIPDLPDDPLAPALAAQATQAAPAAPPPRASVPPAPPKSVPPPAVEVAKIVDAVPADGPARPPSRPRISSPEALHKFLRGAVRKAPAGGVRTTSASTSASTPATPPARAEEPSAPRRRRGPFTRADADASFAASTTSDGVLAALLEFAQQFASYVALFRVHADVAEGWDARGAGASGERVRRMGVPLDLPSMFASARAQRTPIVRAAAPEPLDGVVAADLDRAAAVSAVVVPVVVGARVVAALWLDDGPNPLTLAELDEVVRAAGDAGVALGRLAVAKKHGKSPAAPPPRVPSRPPRAGRTDAGARVRALAAALTPAPTRATSSPSAPRVAAGPATPEPALRAPRPPAKYTDVAVLAQVATEVTAATPAEAPAPSASSAVSKYTDAAVLAQAATEAIAAAAPREPLAASTEASSVSKYTDTAVLAQAAEEARAAASSAPVEVAEAAPRGAPIAKYTDVAVLAQVAAEVTAQSPETASGSKPASVSKYTDVAVLAQAAAEVLAQPPAAGGADVASGAGGEDPGSATPKIVSASPIISPLSPSPPAAEALPGRRGTSPYGFQRVESEEAPTLAQPNFARIPLTAKWVPSPVSAPPPSPPREPSPPVEGAPESSPSPPPSSRAPISAHEGATPMPMAPPPAFASRRGLGPILRREEPDDIAALIPPTPSPPLEADDGPEIAVTGEEELPPDSDEHEHVDASEVELLASEADVDAELMHVSDAELDELLGAPSRADERIEAYAPRLPPRPVQLRGEPLAKVIVELEPDHVVLVDEVLAGGDAGAAAADRLASLGILAVTAIMERFPGPTRASRVDAAAQLPAPSSSGPLLDVLARLGRVAHRDVLARTNDPDADTRFWATYLLTEIPDRAAAGPLLPRLLDEDASVRVVAPLAARAMFAAAPSSIDEVIDPLVEIALDEGATAELRTRAIDALVALREAQAVEGLVLVLDVTEGELAGVAQRALVRLTCADPTRGGGSWSAWLAKQSGRTRTDWLIDALVDEDAALREAASDELKATTKQYFGYYPDLPKSERERAQARYRAWWDAERRGRDA
jgi:hypothetical protein